MWKSSKVNQQKPKTAPSLGKKEPVKKPRPIKTGENIKDILNVFTDPRGQKWEMPIGEMMKSQAKLQEIQAKNEGGMAKESMTLKQKEIEQQMAQMQADIMLKQQEREDRIAEQQSKVNASNQAMAMFGYNPSAQMGQPPAGIYGDVLQSQGQMAQGQLGLIQQQMQNQGQMDVEQYKTLQSNKMQDFLNKMELLKYEQDQMNERAAREQKGETERSKLQYSTKEYVENEKIKEKRRKEIIGRGDTLHQNIIKNRNQMMEKGIINDTVAANYESTSIESANAYLLSGITEKDMAKLENLMTKTENGIWVIPDDAFNMLKDKFDKETMLTIMGYKKALSALKEKPKKTLGLEGLEQMGEPKK